jgi:hypothetical protein
MAQKVRDEDLVNLNPEYGTKPRIWYRNFDRVTHCFLGGALVRRSADVEDCAAGLTVRLLKDGTTLIEQESDTFGEFKFEPLAGGGETYRLQVVDGSASVVFEIEVNLTGNTFLGIIEVP